MLELARLSLRRDRHILTAFAGLLLLSLPLALAGKSREISAREALDATWTFWFFLGLPVFAVVLGAVSGARLSSDAARADENLLPLSPARRAWAAAAASGTELVLLAALVAAAGFAIGVDWDWALAAPFKVLPSWERSGAAALSGLFVLCLPLFLLPSVLGAYASRNGTLGALGGICFGSACLVSLATGLALGSTASFKGSFGWPWVLSHWALAAGGCAAALTATADQLERKPRAGFRTAAAIAASATGGLLLACGGLWWRMHAVRSAEQAQGEGVPEIRLEMDISGKGAAQAAPATEMRETSVWESAGLPRWSRGGGVLLLSPEGDLVWATANGKRKTLVTGEAPLSSYGSDRMDYRWDAAGGLWALAMRSRMPYVFDLYHGTPEDGLKVVSRFQTTGVVEFVRRADTLGLWTGIDGYAPLPSPDRQPAWDASLAKDKDFLLKAALDSGAAAFYDLQSGFVTHRVPGRESERWAVSPPREKQDSWFSERPIAPSRIGGERVFAVTVYETEGWTLRLCRPDGGIRVVWTHARGTPAELHAIETGGLWSLVDGRSVRWLSPSGEAFGPVAAEGVDAESVGLRAEGRRLWLVAGGALVVLEPGAPPRWLAGLPRGSGGVPGHPRLKLVQDGFFWHSGQELYFVDWEGGIRGLGR